MENWPIYLKNLTLDHISQTKTLLENGEPKTYGKIGRHEEELCSRQGQGQAGHRLCGGEGSGPAELQEK